MAKKTSSKTSSTNQDPDAEVVYQYLQKQNRPYSANDIFANLKGEVGKTSLGKVLSQLEADDLIVSKAYGKQVVYVMKQDDLTTLSSEELDQYDSKIENAKDKVTTLKEEVYNVLSNSMTDEELKTKVDALLKENEALEERLIGLRDGGKQLTVEEKNAIEKKLMEARKQWALRKKLFKEIWGAFTENLPKKPKEYMDELGIETDEMVGADINAEIEI